MLQALQSPVQVQQIQQGLGVLISLPHRMWGNSGSAAECQRQMGSDQWRGGGGAAGASGAARGEPRHAAALSHRRWGEFRCAQTTACATSAGTMGVLSERGGVGLQGSRSKESASVTDRHILYTFSC